MLYLVNRSNRHLFQDKLLELFRARKEVFVDECKWDIPHDDQGREIDQFDTDNTVYLLSCTEDDELVAATRMMPTTTPHMMTDVFSYLCDNPSPVGPLVWEGSRYFVRKKFRKTERLRIAHTELLCGMMETCLVYGIEQFIFVINGFHASGMIALGWDIVPLGAPREIDGKPIMAFVVNVRPEGLQAMRRTFGIESRPLNWFYTTPIAA
jgi:acyl-homoserine lactone synthase